MALQAAVGHPEGTRRKPVLPRIEGDPREGVGWPELSAASTPAAAGARGFAGPALRCANKTVVALVLLYGMQRVQRTQAWDQKVTEASPATSPCGGASRLRWRERLGGELGNEAWGKRCSGSPRFFWCCWRGRGGTGSGESTEGITGTRGRKRRRWRCSRASGAA